MVVDDDVSAGTEGFAFCGVGGAFKNAAKSKSLTREDEAEEFVDDELTTLRGREDVGAVAFEFVFVLAALDHSISSAFAVCTCRRGGDDDGGGDGVRRKADADMAADGVCGVSGALGAFVVFNELAAALSRSFSRPSARCSKLNIVVQKWSTLKRKRNHHP